LNYRHIAVDAGRMSNAAKKWGTLSIEEKRAFGKTTPTFPLPFGAVLGGIPRAFLHPLEAASTMLVISYLLCHAVYSHLGFPKHFHESHA